MATVDRTVVQRGGGAGASTKHPEYAKYAEVWDEMRDHLEGSRKIKEEGTKYLPMLGDESNPQDVKNYKAYLERALYYEATKITASAMTGAMLMKPPMFNNLPEKFEDQFDQVTMDGYSMSTFVRNVLKELVAISRTGVLLERSKSSEKSGEQYFVQYNAEDIINWRFERIKDRIVLTLVVLRERIVTSEHRFNNNEETRYRVLELIDGIYVQSLVTETVDENDNITLREDDTIVPTKVGESLDYIPFVFFTPMGNVPTVCCPLLDGIATINTSHYHTSADLEHGRHFTGLPTAWVAGFDEETELRMGSQSAWVTDNAAARAGFLEFTGAGLSTLENALREKQEQMASMGARMLRPPRSGIEAAETAKIYQSAESGTLASLATAASESFTVLIRYWMDWQGADPADASVEINTDYIDSRLDPASATFQLNALLSNAISYETFFYNLKNGEMIPDGVTAEDELDKIAAQGPRSPLDVDNDDTES